MNKLEWFENLNQMNDEQLQHFAKKQKLEFSIEEIQKLRKIFRNASISWGIFGVPSAILQEVEALLGAKRYKKVKKLLLD